MERSPRRWLSLRIWMTAVGVGLLLLVVAAAATEVPGRGTQSRFFSWDAESVAEVVVPVIRFVFLMLFVGALYWWLATRPSRRRGRGRRRPVSPVVVLLALVLVAAWALLIGPRLFGDETTSTTTTSLVEAPTPVTAAPVAEGDAVTPLGRPDLGMWILIALALGAVGYVIVSRRQIDPPPPLGQSRQEALAPSPGVEATDPAGRVFAAYRQVEGASLLSGLGRSPAETVGSHLGRLGPATEAGPAGELAEIYHRARFSSHEVEAESADVAEADGRFLVRKLGE